MPIPILSFDFILQLIPNNMDLSQTLAIFIWMIGFLLNLVKRALSDILSSYNFINFWFKVAIFYRSEKNNFFGGFYYNWRIFNILSVGKKFPDTIFLFLESITFSLGHGRCHTIYFWPDRTSRLDFYRIQTNRQDKFIFILLIV